MVYQFLKDKRIDLPEKMDEPGVSLAELSKAHKELRVINRLLGGYALLVESLEEVDMFDHVSDVIDVGCGSGDNLRVLADHFRRKDRSIKFKGVDINEDAIELARIQSRKYPEITFTKADVWQPFGNADVVTCSLFCHHFNDDVIIALIKRLIESANKAVVINDLHRHWFAYHSIGFLTRFFSKTATL